MTVTRVMHRTLPQQQLELSTAFNLLEVRPLNYSVRALSPWTKNNCGDASRRK